MTKIDLHMHTGEDPYDGLPYTAVQLIDRAVSLGFGAIAITLHRKVIEDQRIFDYARNKGLLLIQAVEWHIEDVDVLLYNVTTAEIRDLHTFEQLRAFKQQKGEDFLVVAPHPYYPVGQSLKHHLERHIDLFDAIEHAQVHLPWLNYNKQAIKVAQHWHKPMVANSDAHNLWMFGRHYSLVDAGPNQRALFQAIKAGRVQWHSPPVTIWDCLRFFVFDPIFERKPGRVINSFPDPQPAK